MLKILAIHQGGELYGSDRSFLTCIESLRKSYKDAKIDVLLHEDGPLKEELIKFSNTVEIRKLSKLSKADLKKLNFGFIWNFLKNIGFVLKKSKEYDLFYINTIVILDFILLSRIVRSRITSIIHVREIQLGLIGKIFSSILSFSKAFLIFNSDSSKKSAIADNSLNNNVVVENGLEGYSFLPPPMIDHKCINILLLGRISHWKGQDFILNAISKLEGKYQQLVNVRIVGSPVEGQEILIDKLIALSSQLNYPDNIEFFPFESDVTFHIEWSSVVVVPSTKPEPFGRVAIEGMSAGRLVLVADHGGLSNIVEDNYSGLKFEPNNFESAASRIREILNDVLLIKTLGTNGKLVFDAKYGMEVFRERFKNAIETALKKKSV